MGRAPSLTWRSTDAYENARDTVAKFLGAESNEIVFVRGATEGFAEEWQLDEP